MANDKPFKIKNGLSAGRYLQSAGTATAGSVADFGNIAYASKSFTPTQGGTAYTQIYIKPDGTKMYVLDASDEAIFQYSLSTAWDVSTATYDSGKTKDITGYGSSHTGLSFSSDGTYVLVMDALTIRRFPLSTAWDISTVTLGNFGSISIGGTQNRSMYVKSDGTYVYWTENSSDVVYQSQMTTAWQPSSCQTPTSFSLASQDTSPLGVTFSPDGLSMLVAGNTNDTVYKYTLSTAWDVTTASYDNYSISVVTQTDSPYSLFSGDNGSKLYIVGYATDTIYQYSTALPTQTLDLSTGHTFSFTPSGATTVSFTNPPASGVAIGFSVEINNTGGSAITWPSSVKWHLGTAPTATATKEVYAFVTTDGGTTYYGIKAGRSVA